MEIRMRSNVCTLILAAASLAPSALLAQPLDRAADGATITATVPGKAVAERVAQISASVEAVDSAQRTVTLKRPAGDIVTLAVGPEVQNFDQIRVGDLVAVRYLEALTLELKKRGTAKRERTERDVTERAWPGERPAAVEAHEVHVVADVIALDPQTQTVTLRGPTRVVDLLVHDPAQFTLVAVGDQVEATYTEAVAISVEPAGEPQ
jgi:antitoxin (DNA-binding transcriptional repressor) of toxin-antitoxin stability system